MFFFDLVHAPVRFRKKLFRGGAVVRMEGAPHADGDDRFAAHGAASFQHSARQSIFHLGHEIVRHLWKDKDEFISAQAADLVVFPAGRFELRGHFLKQLVSGQVPEPVINLFEAIQVAQENDQRPLGTSDAGEFLFKVQANRSGVGQAGEVIGTGSALSLFELKGIFNGNAEFGARGQQQAQMIPSEVVLLAMVKR